MKNIQEIRTLGQVYENFDELDKDSILNIELPDPEFTKFLNQVKAHKVLNVNTDHLGEFTTVYHPKRKKEGGITIKVTCIGSRKIKVTKRNSHLYEED